MSELVKRVEEVVAREMKPNLPAIPSATASAELRGIEDAMFCQACEVTTRAMQFADIDWTSEEPPEEWIEEHGEDGAWRRFRQTKAGQLPSAHAPAGLKVAMAVTMGVIKSREVKSGPKLNVAIVQLSEQPQANYPVQDIEHE